MKAYERFRLHRKVDDEHEGVAVVIVAFVINALVAVAKTVAAMLTGSASLRTEAIHSWVDTANELFVVAAQRTARKPSDEAHALGYGRESYVWSLFASLGMLALGAVAGIWQGIGQLRAPELGGDYAVGYVVVAVSFVLEGASFVQSLRQVRKQADELGRDVFEHALKTSNSPMRAVFTEDFIALIALAIAALGIGLHQATGVAAYDAAGSILIGVVMATAAVMLIVRNGRFLSGSVVSREGRASIIGGLRANAEVQRISFVYAEFIGPDRLLVLAGVGLAGEHTQAELAATLRAIERRLMEHDYIGVAILTLADAGDPDLVE